MDSTDLLLYGGASETGSAEKPPLSLSRQSCNPDDNYFSPSSHLVSTFVSSQRQTNTANGGARYDKVFSDTYSEKRDMKTIIERLSLVVKEFASVSPGPPACNRRDAITFTPDDFLPPMDSMICLKSTRLQRDRFLDEVEVGDVFCCSIVSINSAGLDVVLLCYACKRNREIDQLKLTASCSCRDIPELLFGEKKEVSDVFSVKDKVTGVVIGLGQYSENIQISLLERDLPRNLDGTVTLGLTRSEELPHSYRTMCMSDDLSYSQILQTSTMFQSPGITERLCKRLSIDDDIGACSLLTRINRKPIRTEEKGAALRKQQSKIHALHSVVEGVKLYKEGKQGEAMALYNKALDIDNDNVEALVARGAMYANNESYQRALEDFQQALKVNPGHQNALDYTVQTLLAYARDLEDIKDSDLAMKCYKELLVLDPSNASAQEGLTTLERTRAMSADQQPVVSSTRGDLCSPYYSRKSRTSMDGRLSKDSPTSSGYSRERRSSRRSHSIERRRRSIMFDRQISRDSGRTHNEERVVPKRSRPYRSSSCSSLSSSDPERRQSRKKDKSPTKLSRSRRTKRSRFSSSSRRRSSDSRSPSARKHSADRGRSHTHRQLSQSNNERKTRRRSSSLEKRGNSSRTFSNSSDRRKSDSLSIKEMKETPEPYVSKESMEGVLNDDLKESLDKSEYSPSSQQQSGGPAAEVKDSSAAGPSVNLDRYGFPRRDNFQIDIFSNLATQPAAPVVENKESAVTPFLPYCLTTDPLNRTQAKKTRGGDKSLGGSTAKANDGKRKALMTPNSSKRDKKEMVDSSTKALSHSSESSKARKRKDSSRFKSRRRTKSRSLNRSTSRSTNRSNKRKRSRSRNARSRSHNARSRSRNARSRSRNARSRSRNARSRSHNARSRSRNARSRSRNARSRSRSSRTRSCQRTGSRSHGKARSGSHAKSSSSYGETQHKSGKHSQHSEFRENSGLRGKKTNCGDQLKRQPKHVLSENEPNSSKSTAYRDRIRGDSLQPLKETRDVKGSEFQKFKTSKGASSSPPIKAAHHQYIEVVKTSGVGLAVPDSQPGAKVVKKGISIKLSSAEKKEKQDKLQKMEDFLASLKSKKNYDRTSDNKS